MTSSKIYEVDGTAHRARDVSLVYIFLDTLRIVDIYFFSSFLPFFSTRFLRNCDTDNIQNIFPTNDN